MLEFVKFVNCFQINLEMKRRIRWRSCVTSSPLSPSTVNPGTSNLKRSVNASTDFFAFKRNRNLFIFEPGYQKLLKEIFSTNVKKEKYHILVAHH